MNEASGIPKSGKRDFKQELKHLYAPSTQKVEEVEVPEMQFVMIDGIGDPNTAQEYINAIEALYAISYALKFLLKKEASIEYVVMPLEGLWWADNGRNSKRESWQWTMMIMQPNNVTNEWFSRAIKQAQQKRLPALEKLRLESLHEKRAAQIMHIGPFANEEQTLEKMERFFAEHEYVFQGKHHEIYLRDPRRTAPEKLHTVLRQPFKLS